MITVIFGTTEFETAVTILAPALMMPLHSASRPTMNPLTSCRKISGTPFWVHSGEKREEFGLVIFTQSAEKAPRFLMAFNQNLDPPNFLHYVKLFKEGSDDAR